MHIHHITVKNFRGIKKLDWTVNSNLACLIGPCDSCKTTILKALEYALYPYHSLVLHDYDFYNCDIDHSIEIRVTIGGLADELMNDAKYAGYIQFIDKDGVIYDELESPEDTKKPVLTISLTVDNTLEPKWLISNDRTTEAEEEKTISSADRARINLFNINEYSDNHLTWSFRSPLTKIFGKMEEQNQFLTEAMRKIRELELTPCSECTDQDCGNCKSWGTIRSKILNDFAYFGINTGKLSPRADFRDNNTASMIALHDEKIPLRLKGKGNKRLASIAIQKSCSESGAIILADEVETGLEPFKLRHLIKKLQQDTGNGQVFTTTHSPVAIEEFDYNEIFVTRENQGKVDVLPLLDKLQPYLRANSEAFLARRIIVGEGPTEEGFCLGLDEVWQSSGKPSFAFIGIATANGGGDSHEDRAFAFRDLGYDTALIKDSDVKPGALENILTVEWEDGLCLEKIIARDLPFGALQELLGLAVSIKSENEEKADQSVLGRLQTRMQEICNEKGVTYNTVSTLDPSDWGYEQQVCRDAIGRAASDSKSGKGWFKDRESGIKVAKLVSSHLSKIPETILAKKVKSLEDWVFKDE